MFYSIFMALYYVLISISIFTFKFCWEIPCGEAFNFVETIQPICGASQMSGFCMVWVFTVKNIRADYRFCCFNINKLNYYTLITLIMLCNIQEGFLLVPYLDAGQYRSVEGVCIPLHGNLPLGGNSVCILFISSQPIGIFQLNFAVLIQVSIETF